MYTDRFNFKGDHSSVAKELFSDVSDFEAKLLAIEESVNKGYFNLHEALENYDVSEIEYLPFILSKIKIQLKDYDKQTQMFKAISAVIAVFDYPVDNSFSNNGILAVTKIKKIAQAPSSLNEDVFPK